MIISLNIQGACMKFLTMTFFTTYLLSVIAYPMDKAPDEIEMLIVSISKIDLSEDGYAALPEELLLTIFTSLDRLAIYEIWWLRVVCKGWYQVIKKNAASIRVALNINPLCWAAAFGKVDKIIALKLDGRYSLRQPDEYGLTPACFAIASAQHSAMKILRIGMALETKLQDIEYLKTFVPAYDDETHALLKEGESDPIYFPEQLMQAVENRDFDAVFESLLKDPSFGFRCDMVCILRAKEAGEKIHRLLLFCKQAGFEHFLFDCMSEYLENPSDYFSKFMLCGANPNAYNEEGKAFLHLAAMHSDYLPILQELLKCDGINTDIRTMCGEEDCIGGLTAQHTAADYGAIDCLRALLDSKQSDIDAIANDGYCYRVTPLHCAVLHNQVACVTLLIEKGARVDEPDTLNQTPLFYAMFWGESRNRCMEQLICAGADIEKISNDKTPLHYAIKEGQLEAVLVLCHYNANMNWKNQAGQTALDVARDCGFQEIIDFLEEKMS